MSAVILDGTRGEREVASLPQEVLVAAVASRADEVTTFRLREMNIRHCLGCFGCWIKTPGECVIDDDARQVTRAIAQSDLVVYLTPITFGGHSSHLKKALDRNIGLISPDFANIDGETHHKKRYTHYPRLLAVGLLDRADVESERIFSALIAGNAINMHAPAHASIVVYGDAGIGRARADLARALDELEEAK